MSQKPSWVDKVESIVIRAPITQLTQHKIISLLLTISSEIASEQEIDVDKEHAMVLLLQSYRQCADVMERARDEQRKYQF